MKRKRLILLLSAMLAVLPANCLAAGAASAGKVQSASAVGLAQGKNEKTVYIEVNPSGNASSAGRPEVRLYSSGGFPGSYGKQLDGLARTLYNSMENAYVKKKKTGAIDVPVSSYKLKAPGQYGWETSGNAKDYEALAAVQYAVQASYDALMYDYPELFWLYRIGGGVSFDTRTSIITSIEIVPEEWYDGAGDRTASFSKAVDKAVKEIKSRYSCTTKWKTVRAIHDYLCKRLTYEYQDNPAIYAYTHTAAGVFLKNGRVVCEGYAKAFKILCGKFGITAILVSGDAGGPHMWNYVMMGDKKWYAVDMTWDDREGASADDTYFLIGSNTEVENGDRFGMTRILATRFSDAYSGSTGSTKNFVFPILNSTSYNSGKSTHTHKWKVLAETEPTCTRGGRIIYECSCGEETTELLEPLGHSFIQKKYVYNKDATVFKDGTKTVVCDNGCGQKGWTVKASGTKLEPTIKLNASKLTLKVGQSTKALKVSGLAKGDSVKGWKSSDTKVVRVSGSGKITAKKVGRATLTVTLKSGLKKKIQVTVQKGTVRTTKISGVAAALTMKKGGTKKLAPVVTPITSGQKLSFTSSNKKVATVSGAGKITAKKKGTTTITVKSGAKSVKCKLTVK